MGFFFALLGANVLLGGEIRKFWHLLQFWQAVEAAEGLFVRRGGETTLTLSMGFKLGPEEQVLRPGSSAMTINCRKLHKRQNDGGGEYNCYSRSCGRRRVTGYAPRSSAIIVEALIA